MISSNKLPNSGNALIRRMQRYAQASTIFRSSDTIGDVANNTVQRSAVAPTKATLLSSPSTLPMGRTVDAQGMGSMPVMADSFPEPFSTIPEPTIPSAAAAIEHVEQIQRSPASQVSNSPQAAATPQRQTAPPVADATPTTTPTPSSANVVQAAPEPETAVPDSDWSRLQRIIKGHEGKGTASQSTPTAPPTVQRGDAKTTEPPVAPTDTIQRAINSAESNQAAPVTPKKAPLESIWPVQQVSPEPAATSDEPVVMQQPDTPISAEPVQSADEIETIRRKLDDVSATQRTDSSVELHLPRRPRPPVLQAKPTQEDTNKSFWDRMRNIEGKAPETVQRTVETEIGPLPADMWELLGETPPGSPTETVTTSGESSPTIQPKREADALSSQPSATEETEIPSFLAKASEANASVADAQTAPNTPDTVHRAIAAAESTASSETTGSNIQRKETAVSEPTPPTTPLPSSESVEQPMASPSVSTTESQVIPAIQRSPEIEGSDVEPTPSVETHSESISLPSDAEVAPSIEVQSAPTSESSATVQRAIAAAETPPAAGEITSTTTPNISRETSTTAADQSVQPKRTDSAIESSAKPAMKAVMPEPIVTDTIQREFSIPDSDMAPKTTVDLNAETGPLPPLPEMASSETAVPLTPSVSDASSSTPDPVQRAIAAAEAPVSTTSEPSETAVSTPDASATTEASTPETIQRAIAAAEAPVSTTSEPSETAVSTPEALPTTEASTPETIQRAVTAAEAPVSTPSIPSETAVSTPDASATTSEDSTSEIVQRAIAAVEASTSIPTAPPETTASTPNASPTTSENATGETIQRAVDSANTPDSAPATPSQTAVSTPKAAPLASEDSTPDSIQRAIAAAESLTSIPSAPSQETVYKPETTPSTTEAYTPETLQRAIADVEAPISAPTAPSQTAVSTPTISPTTSKASTPDAIQRAIGIAETPITKPDPATIHDSQATISRPQSQNLSAAPQTAVQRAIAAAELAPSMKTTTSVIQRAQTAPQTAVTQPTAFVQDNGWQSQTETAVATPTAPTVTHTSAPSLMRAIAAAEATTEPVKETHQWPDISPTSTPKSDNNIQRYELDEESTNFQEYNADSASGMEDAESADESLNQVDVDKLANEVYSQLRKRLAIEWERGRGKR